MTWRFFILLVLIQIFTGCDDQPTAELKSWMKQSHGQVQTKIKKLPPPVSFEAYTYKPAERLDPFDAKKIYAGFSAETAVAGSLQPDPHRHREPLERYMIDQLKMVGTLRRTGYSLALIEAEKIIYQVRVGSHLGQDMGKVVRINEDSIEIDEMVQDSSGSWNLRRTQLSLKEK